VTRRGVRADLFGLPDEDARARARHRETAAERAAIIAALGETGWRDLLTRRRATRLARARLARAARRAS
jgi:hypothetical protein